MPATNSINFFRTQNRVAKSQEALDAQVFKFGSVAFGIVAVLTLLSVGWWQWTLSQERQLAAQKRQQERVIAQSTEEEKQYLSFVTRLDALQTLLEARNSKKEALDFLALLAQPSLGFDSIEYDARSKQLSFRVQATSVFSVEAFLAELREPDISAYYEALDVSNIRRDEAGGYNMDIAATLKGGLSDGQ